MTPFRSHRLRYGRYSETKQIYLVTTVTHSRKPVFADFMVGRLLVSTMKPRHDPQRVSSLAFVVMLYHVDCLIQLQDENINKVMRAFKGVSSRKVNQYLDLKGKLWQAGYHDHALRKEEDLPNLAGYIVANRLRAGLVKK